MLDIPTDNGTDRVFERLVASLETEFGSSAAEGLARVFIEAEAADFYWDARREVRWLGAYESPDPDDDEMLDRVAVAGIFGGRCYVALLLVDGLGGVHAMLGLRKFASRLEAERAFAAAR